MKTLSSEPHRHISLLASSALILCGALLPATTPAATCLPAPAGLVGWWPGDASAIDLAGTNHGTLWGNAGFTNGVVNGAFSFEGTNSGVLIAGQGSYCPMDGGLTNIGNTFTIELWVKPSASRQTSSESAAYGCVDGAFGQRYAIFPSWGGTSGAAGLGLSVGTNGISVAEHAHNYLPTTLVWNGPVQGWTHVALVYQARQPKLYVDGTWVRTGLTSAIAWVYPSTSLGGNPVDIAGSRWRTYGPYIGLLDEVSVYNRALSATEVAAICAAGAAAKCKPQPRILLGNDCFSSGRFTFFALGQAGRTVVVEASADAANWFPIQTNVLTMAPLPCCDPASPLQARRFYRLVLQ